MAALTVGYVAGLIAFLTFVVSFLFPNIIALLIAAFVGTESSAVTWSVVGRELHSSVWPTLLRSDTTTSSNLPTSIRALSWLQKIAYVLVTVASIVTPLGLQSRFELEGNSRNETFSYAADSGPMAYGTPPRDPNQFYSRVCNDDQMVGECPFSDTKVTYRKGGFLGIKPHWEGTYDVRIPYVTAEVFSSAHDEHATSVSSAFDIEWRQYTYAQDPEYNNGEKYVVGFYRPLTSLLLDDTIEVVEGLLVDTQKGGIAFRNHTAPSHVQVGAEWTEDLLFVSPETVCVDTNLTLDYQLGPSGTYAKYQYAGVANVAVTDHGGFVNLDHTYPEPAGGTYGGQDDSNLYFRAHKGAWINNAWTALYFNVTNPSEGKYDKAFEYMDSHVGKKFWLNPFDVGYASPNVLQISPDYGSYLPSTISSYSSKGANRLNDSTTDPRAKYPNPWYVTSDNFSIAAVLCQGAGGEDHANISNIAVGCGLMYGAATRQDGESNLIQEPGSWWSQKMFSCATANKVDIKRVTFNWNGTSEESHLRRLQVVKVCDKVYDKESDMPFWAAENLHRQLINMNPLWGLVSSKIAKKYANTENFDVVQSPRFYVPGWPGFDILPTYSGAEDNLAASKAFVDGLAHSYSVSEGSEYSGSSSMAILSKWQQLGRNASTAAHIPNLIWTDVIANALVGTRSWLSTNDLPNNIQPKSDGVGAMLTRRDASSGESQVPVFLYQEKVAFNWLYGIPAIMTLVVFALVLALGLFTVLVGRFVRPNAMSLYLNYTSAGRLLSIISEKDFRDDESTTKDELKSQVSLISSNSKPLADVWENDNIYASSREWVNGKGTRTINLVSISQDHTHEKAALSRVDEISIKASMF